MKDIFYLDKQTLYQSTRIHQLYLYIYKSIYNLELHKSSN